MSYALTILEQELRDLQYELHILTLADPHKSVKRIAEVRVQMQELESAVKVIKNTFQLEIS